MKIARIISLLSLPFFLSILPGFLLSGCISVSPRIGTPVVIEPATPVAPGAEVSIYIEVISEQPVSYLWQADENGGEIKRGQNSSAAIWQAPQATGTYNVHVNIKTDDTVTNQSLAIRVEVTPAPTLTPSPTLTYTPTPSPTATGTSTPTPTTTYTSTPTTTFTPTPTDTTIPPPTNTATLPSTRPPCPDQMPIDQLIQAEANAANDTANSKDRALSVIRTIFVENAVIVRADTGEQWTDAYQYYDDLFSELSFQDARHFDIRQVGTGEGGNIVYYTSGSEGDYRIGDGDWVHYYNPSRADLPPPFGSDQWTLRRNEAGCWQIIAFSFNAGSVPFPPTNP